MRNIIYPFFWWLAGANINILKEHEEDYEKYFQIGVAVFTTALMATITSGFAIHYAINNGFSGLISLATIIGSLFWGFIIMSLDRFLVLSVKKEGNSLIEETPYEKFQNFKKEIIYVFPRLILALLISQIILEPLELYLFKDQVANYIKVIQEKEKKNFIDIQNKKLEELEKQYNKDKNKINNIKKIDTSESEKQISDIQNKKDPKLLELEEDLKRLEKKYNDTNKQYKDARENRDKELKTGKGPNYYKSKELAEQLLKDSKDYKQKVKEKNNEIKEYKNSNEHKNFLDQKNKEIKKSQQELIEIRNQNIQMDKNKHNKIEQINQEYDKKKKEIKKEINNYNKNYQGNNLIIALKAKNELFNTDPKYNQLHLLLLALLITIELLPIILKLLFSRSSYDAHIQKLVSDKLLKFDASIRDNKLKYQMEYKRLIMEENKKNAIVENNLKKLKLA